MRAACAIAPRSRFFSRLLLVSLAAAGVADCQGTGLTVQQPLITLGLDEPARWIEPAELRRYQCELGSLVCTSAAGRLTTRLCRCVVGPDDIANPLPRADVGE